MATRKVSDSNLSGKKYNDASAGGSKIADLPDAPTIGTATDTTNGGEATVDFTAAATGGTATGFTATSSPDSITGTGASAPITLTGLTDGTTYSFTVYASNASGNSSASQSSNTVVTTTAYQTSFSSIATITVGSGGASNITFSSIPQTYTHLQIRLFVRPTSSSNGPVFMQLNSDTGTNYSRHAFRADGGTVYSSGSTSQTSMYFNGYNVYSAGSSYPTVTIIDILDYTNTNKNKTVKAIAGLDNNGAGEVGLYSGAWFNTNAINSIKLFDNVNYGQYTQAALYGIKA